MWLLILEWDWLTRSHARSPLSVASKRTISKKYCLQKKSLLVYGKHMNSALPTPLTRWKWGLRETLLLSRKWSFAACVPTSTGSSIFQRHSLQGWLDTPIWDTHWLWARALEDSAQGLHWQNQVSATLHRRNLAKAGGTYKDGEKECGLNYSLSGVSSIKSPIISTMDCNSKKAASGFSSTHRVLRKNKPPLFKVFAFFRYTQSWNKPT